jgi:predicted nucleotide-binding protein
MGQELLSRQLSGPPDVEQLETDYERWHSYNLTLLDALFSTNELAHEYGWCAPLSTTLGPPTLAYRVQRTRERINAEVRNLTSVVDRLGLYPEPVVSGSPPFQPRPAQDLTHAFIVHGHDEAARESVARLLSELGIEPIILLEQPSGGRTVIEKLEHYSDVGFAIVLLTPDDEGRELGADSMRARARQNVVMELGYFIGKLARLRVCPLYKGDLELPSDYHGVVYVQMDDGGGWKYKLANEMKLAGYDIDKNKIS